MGMSVELKVTVAEVKGRAVTLDLEGRDGIDLICRGSTTALLSTLRRPRRGSRPRRPRRGSREPLGDRARRVPTYCYQCVAGPDLLTVKVVDGVATEVEPNFCAAGVHPGGGKVCVKAFGLVQKTYNPNRVLTPMKRTNPRKGRDEDPASCRSAGTMRSS